METDVPFCWVSEKTKDACLQKETKDYFRYEISWKSKPTINDADMKVNGYWN